MNRCIPWLAMNAKMSGVRFLGGVKKKEFRGWWPALTHSLSLVRKMGSYFYVSHEHYQDKKIWLLAVKMQKKFFDPHIHWHIVNQFHLCTTIEFVPTLDYVHRTFDFVVRFNFRWRFEFSIDTCHLQTLKS